MFHYIICIFGHSVVKLKHSRWLGPFCALGIEKFVNCLLCLKIGRGSKIQWVRGRVILFIGAPLLGLCSILWTCASECSLQPPPHYHHFPNICSVPKTIIECFPAFFGIKIIFHHSSLNNCSCRIIKNKSIAETNNDGYRKRFLIMLNSCRLQQSTFSKFKGQDLYLFG